MTNYKLNYNILKEPNYVKYEIFSFMKIISSQFDLTPFVEDCIRIRIHEIWDQYQVLFKKIKYEDVLLALTMYCHEYDGGFESLPIHQFIKYMYGENSKSHEILIFKTYNDFRNMFSSTHAKSIDSID